MLRGKLAELVASPRLMKLLMDDSDDPETEVRLSFSMGARMRRRRVLRAAYHGKLYLFFGNAFAFGTEGIASRASWRRPARSGGRSFGARPGLELARPSGAAGRVVRRHHSVQAAAAERLAAPAASRRSVTCCSSSGW